MFYSAYGLTIDSNCHISGLTSPAENSLRVTADLFVEFGSPSAAIQRALRSAAIELPTSRFARYADDPKFSLSKLENGEFFQLSYSDGTRFLVKNNANYVWGDAGPHLTDDDLAVYLLGPILGFVLRCKGRLALHASAVSIDGRAIALMGPAGAGKSTTAAALALRGWPVCCEDVCALAGSARGTRVLPGYPRICLWPDSVKLLFSRDDSLPLIVKGWEKRYLALDGSLGKFTDDATPLGAIYFLAPRSDDSSRAVIRPLSQKETTLLMVQNTYMNWLLDKSQRAAEFDVVVKLVSEVPCFEVVPSAGQTGLSETAVMIEAHALSLNG